MSATTIASILTSPNGLQIKGGPFIKDATKELSGRFYLTSNWALSNGWNFLPGGSIGLAQDVPVSINATVASTNSSSQITFNSSNSHLYYPYAGKIRINAWASSNATISTSNGYEFRICTFASPAWPATGQAAKTYGTIGQSNDSSNGGANGLANYAQSRLKQANFVSYGLESGIEWDGIVSAGTEIAILVYSSGSNGNMTFPGTGLYFDTGYDYILQ